ncbi:Uncharacterised protein [Zhongshania aliphaticivorans]|uniref:RNA polymerase-associated protein RapA n=1 Tax=Zhongshania aliphaticivorans TaxID=1470434 RepID=A0A5S9MX99_9GAMM|nr:DEAD/DEAH box helicase [Zhongshania aliphaticivorans]CAA0081043.1 Uncharacterised protein [Zhongshania aliphaticivorans]CAA0085310.1 Uncharacterised protein [Zhongshania aliphaticivorans]
MALKDFIKRFRSNDAEPKLSWKIDPFEGVAFVFEESIVNSPEDYALQDPLFGMQYTYLKGLEEQGMAERFRNGILVYSRFITEQDDQFALLFELPPLYSGKYQARIEGNSSRANFSVELDLLLPDGSTVTRYQIQGPFLKLSESELFRMSTADWLALEHLKKHQQLPPEERTEFENNWLIFELQTAAKAGMPIDLAQFKNIDIVHPESIGVSMDLLSNGDLLLTPSFGEGVNPDDVRARLGQFRGSDKHAILRVKNKFVLLDEDRINAAEEILTQKRIPKDQIQQFLKTPTAYLDAALIDLDTGFSLRVDGAERYEHHYFGEVEQSSTDWFATSLREVEPFNLITSHLDSSEKIIEIEEIIENAKKTSSDAVEFEGKKYDISNSESVSSTLDVAKSRLKEHAHQGITNDEAEDDHGLSLDKAVVSIKKNDDEADFSQSSVSRQLDITSQSFVRDNLKRDPYPHQEEGIQWLLAHLESSRQSETASGALLADDMGLGKTYMALVGISEWIYRIKKSGKAGKPYLIVAPLSLLENWVAEVEQTFIKSPFKDIVTLQSSVDLNRFRIKGAGRETQQSFGDEELIAGDEKIRYALKIGSHYGVDRLDVPGRLVLTTYQTLRDYQFSLSRVDWSIATFDEAQNIKNPNSMATIAAKALKADFKLLATGTPVENSLKDFWCIMDTSVPGLLGSWQDFRNKYIAPITSSENIDAVREIKAKIGRQLREQVGDIMLRRTKAEKLDGLPSKLIYTGDTNSEEGVYLQELEGMMTGRQLAFYDNIIDQVNAAQTSDKRSIVLSSLHQMKLASIDPSIAAKETIPRSKQELVKQAEESVKIQSLLKILSAIQGRNEKALVFAISKSVQAYLVALVQTVFGIPVEIINGDTAAVSLRDPSQTRKGIIDTFQNKPGFGVIVMSPVAAGVGLTVVGANNVIHLERHWNPAKEAQATDRVYRIGQTKDVNVYLPIALHPNKRSFDQHLSYLLAGKIDLSDAVVSHDTVEQDEMMDCF